MTDINKTIKELNDIITYLKSKVDSTTTYADDTEKAAWEKRISDLSTNDSTHELSLPGLAEFETSLGKDITDLIKQRTELEAAKKHVETERDDKQAIITTKEAELTHKETELQAKIAEIAGLTEAKLTQEVVNKINALGGDSTKLEQVKTLLEELKNNSQPKQEESLQQLPPWMNYVGFGATILTPLLLLIFAWHSKNKRKNSEFDE